MKEETMQVQKMQKFVRKQVLKGKKYEWSNGGEAEVRLLKIMGDLPEAEEIQKSKIKNKKYLKFHLMKNAMHDGDREKATSIVQNLVLN